MFLIANFTWRFSAHATAHARPPALSALSRICGAALTPGAGSRPGPAERPGGAPRTPSVPLPGHPRRRTASGVAGHRGYQFGTPASANALTPIRMAETPSAGGFGVAGSDPLGHPEIAAAGRPARPAHPLRVLARLSNPAPAQESDAFSAPTCIFAPGSPAPATATAIPGTSPGGRCGRVFPSSAPWLRPDLADRLRRTSPRSCAGQVRFMLSAEISTIRGCRPHHRSTVQDRQPALGRPPHYRP